MDDRSIVELYWSRDGRAIAETQQKYGSYCARISANLLEDARDCEENLSDTWLAAWNAIPPARPEVLPPFLGRIARNLALNRLKARRAEKRGGDSVLSLEELDGCIPDGKRLEESLEAWELARSISAFLRTEPGEARQMFVLRYFYCEPVEAIAQRLGVGQSKVKSALSRTRRRLRQHLEKEGMIHEA